MVNKMDDDAIQGLIEDFEVTHPSGSDAYIGLTCKILDVLLQLQEENKALKQEKREQDDAFAVAKMLFGGRRTC